MKGSITVNKPKPTEKGKPKARPRVKMFTLSTCGHCKRTKDFLSDCLIEYDYVDLDLLDWKGREKVLEELRSFNHECTVPTIVIGDEVITGYDERRLREVLKL